MKNFGKISLLGSLLVASASFACATTISPTQQNLVPSLIASPLTTGGVLFASTSGSLTGQTTFTATFSEQVVQGGTGSLCASCLDFVFSFNNSGPAQIEEIGVSSFLGYTTNGDYIANSTLVPSLISETGLGTINYNFADVTGTAGDSVVIFTNAVNVQPGYITLQDSTAGNAVDLAPSAAAPEPSSLILLGSGLMGGAGLLFRKRKLA